MSRHEFTKKIIEQLSQDTKLDGEEILNSSPLLQYINIKTKSANRGSKSRGSFANLYAIFILVEDYIDVVIRQKKNYSKYEGAIFSELFKRQRELPFGSKLQNHALNHRLNEEFHKYFPSTTDQVILRDIPSSRYWINTNLIQIKYNSKKIDLSLSIISIINLYIEAKKDAFESFIKACEDIKKISSENKEKGACFVNDLLQPKVDARLFEIVSFSILKYYYHDKEIYWGYSLDKLEKEKLKLYKTGRTNANDGGIDFVMRPLGYFFQVTETLDFKKYFLDIDKLEHYPIRFVIKTNDEITSIKKHLHDGAIQQFSIDKIVNKYMDAIEEIINIPQLISYFNEALKKGFLNQILDEILIQSKVEFNYQDETDDIEYDDEE